MGSIMVTNDMGVYDKPKYGSLYIHAGRLFACAQ